MRCVLICPHKLGFNKFQSVISRVWLVGQLKEENKGGGEMSFIPYQCFSIQIPHRFQIKRKFLFFPRNIPIIYQPIASIHIKKTIFVKCRNAVCDFAGPRAS
jgi:hypothetical protein